MILYIIIGIGALLLGGGGVWFLSNTVLKSRTQNIIAEAENEAKVLKDKKMLEVKEKNKPKAAKVEDLFAAGVQARKALQEMCDNAYGDGKAKISVLVYVPAEAQGYPTATDCEFSL